MYYVKKVTGAKIEKPAVFHNKAGRDHFQITLKCFRHKDIKNPAAFHNGAGKNLSTHKRNSRQNAGAFHYLYLRFGLNDSHSFPSVIRTRCFLKLPGYIFVRTVQ